jgi:hypothetical protein
MKPKQAPIEWNPGKPDEGELVLVRLNDAEEPIAPAFVNEGEWCWAASALRIQYQVKGYMSLEDAATKLDRKDSGR